MAEMSPTLKNSHGLSVMLNLMCQLDWVTGCPNIQLNTLGVSMRVFLNEISI